MSIASISSRTDSGRPRCPIGPLRRSPGVSGSHGYSTQCRTPIWPENGLIAAKTDNSPHSTEIPGAIMIRVSEVRLRYTSQSMTLYTQRLWPGISTVFWSSFPASLRARTTK
jgi:hypothetical protein